MADLLPNINQFQSTPPREGRPKDVEADREELQFQSTPPREGRPKLQADVAAGKCFNPRPRERGD